MVTILILRQRKLLKAYSLLADKPCETPVYLTATGNYDSWTMSTSFCIKAEV
jgi:hypothetical protein